MNRTSCYSCSLPKNKCNFDFHFGQINAISDVYMHITSSLYNPYILSIIYFGASRIPIFYSVSFLPTASPAPYTCFHCYICMSSTFDDYPHCQLLLFDLTHELNICLSFGNLYGLPSLFETIFIRACISPFQTRCKRNGDHALPT